MTKSEIEFKIAELLAEIEEQEKFEQFIKTIPSMYSRRKTEEAHLPLMYITSANSKGEIKNGHE